ncbi:MAG: hypothetical protein AMS15_07685 [Planctomycetes bacterium DG_23]|nr:MAG: hypothetical protein AMS15_07685 [Planctomycetes bacterium DG_23]
MKKTSNISFLEIVHSVVRFLNIFIGVPFVILITFFIFGLGPGEGVDEDVWLHYIGMVYIVPFVALVFNGILNKWEKPPGRAISIILFIIFVLSTAFAVILFVDMLLGEPIPAGQIFAELLFGGLALFFLINAGLTLRGVFRKKSRQLEE